MGDPTDSGMAPQSFEIAQDGLGKGGLVRCDRLGKPALRPSSETVITLPIIRVAKVGNHDVAAEMAREWFRQVTEAIMSDAFQDRENTFEKQFAHDENLRFKAVARRNKAVAHWVAETKGLSGADAEKYASEFVGAQIGKSDDDVATALKADLARSDIDLSDHRLRKKMDEEMIAAIASVKAGK
jgi:hypothetical protein